MQARTPDGFEAPTGAAGNGKTAQSYIAGIGASGALLAGAVVTFVFLVGTVSFEVWPAASNSGGGTKSLGVAELSGGGDGSASASLGTTVALIADSVPSPDVVAATAAAAPKAGGGLNGTGGGTDEGSGGTDEGTGGSTGDGSGGTAGGEPGSGGGGNGGGANDPSDRPGHSGPRPTDGPGSTGTGTAGAPPSNGSDSDRPSAGDRGRG